MSDKTLNEGYQPIIGYVQDGYQPRDRRGYQSTTQPIKNVTPPSTDSNVRPATTTDKKQ